MQSAVTLYQKGVKEVADLKEFRSVNIDLEKGIYEVNGRDISKSGKELHLCFEYGSWSLVVSEETIYSSDHKIKG